MLHLFRTEVLTPSDNDTWLTKDIQTMIMEYLNEKYDDQITDDLLDMASLDEPCFKTQYIKATRLRTSK